jgi:hypothetical protein
MRRRRHRFAMRFNCPRGAWRMTLCRTRRREPPRRSAVLFARLWSSQRCECLPTTMMTSTRRCTRDTSCVNELCVRFGSSRCPLRAQSHRDPRNDYRQVLRSHPDEAAAIVAENGVRLTKRARNALEPAVVESSIDIPAEPVTEPVEPQALPLFSFAPAKKPSVNRRRAVKSTSATTRRRRERDRLRRRRR